MKTPAGVAKRRALRLASLLVVSLLVLFGSGALFLASSAGKALVLRTLSQSLLNQFNVEARAEALDYRLGSLGVTFHAVTVRQSAATRAFLSMQRVDVDFAPAALLGQLSIRRLDITKPEVVLDATTQGASADRAGGFRASSSATNPLFEIQNGEVRDLALTSLGADGTRFSVRGLSLSFAGEGPAVSRGTVVVSGGLSVTRGTSQIDFERASADVSLTGTSLALTTITMQSPVAVIGATAHLDVAGGNLDAKYDARVFLGNLATWLPELPRLEGELEASGTIRGTVADPIATFDGHVEGLHWQAITDASVSASGRWSGTNLTIDRYDAASFELGTKLNGNAYLVAGDDGVSSVRAEGRVENGRRLAAVIGTAALPVGPLTLVADLAWPGPVLDPQSVEGRVEIAIRNATDRQASLATIAAQGERGHWSVKLRGALEGDTRVAGDISVRIDHAGLPQSTLAGHFDAQSAKLQDAMRDLGRQGLLPADLDGVLKEGRATADATLAGTLAAPRLEAKLTAESLAVGGVDQIRGEALVRLAGRTIEITRITADASGNHVEVRGTALAGGGPIHLAADARLSHPEVLATAFPPEWRPTGMLIVSATLDGSTVHPRLAARVSGSGLEANGIVVDALDGNVNFAQGVLDVTALRLLHGEGSLRLDGNIDTHTDRIRISGRGEKLTAAVRSEALQLDDATISFDVAGSPTQPAGTLSMVAGAIAIDDRPLGRVELTATSADGAVRFDVRLPASNAHASGRIALEPGWPFAARGDLRKSELTSLASLLKTATAQTGLTGTLTATADVTGRLDRPFDSIAVITIPEIDGQLQGRPLRLVRPGRIRFDGRRPTVEEPFQIAAGDMSISLAALPDGDHGILLTFEGRIEDGMTLMPPEMAVPWRAEGTVRAQVSLAGDADRFTLGGDAEATIDRLIRDGSELARGINLQARIREQRIEISTTGGVVLEAPLTASGQIPLAWIVPDIAKDAIAQAGDARTAATLSARSNVAIAPALEALGIKNTNVSGAATIAIEARAAAPRLSEVAGTLTIETAQVSVEDLGLMLQAPTTVRFERGLLDVSASDWKGPRAFLRASGAIGLLPGTEGAFRAEGSTSLAVLRMIAPGIGGDASFQVRVAGPPGARDASATIDLNDVNIIEPQWQLALAGLSGQLTLAAGVLDTPGLRGQLNGGDLTIEGAVPIRAGIVAPRPLNVDARGLFVEIPKGLRSQLDSHLSWEHVATGSRLSGEITIASDSYREPITELAAAVSTVAPGGAPKLPVAPWIAATILDIRLTSPAPIVVDQSMLNVELVPDLTIAGTIGQPALDGQVTIQDEGRIRAGGRSYRLTESRLEFSPADGLVPRLNLIGEAQVSSYLVTLRMTGPANQIETNFSSDPPLSERDVRSLLVTGQIADPTRGTTDSDTFAVGAVSGDVLGVAGRFVGLDTVTVGTEDIELVSSDVDPATRLTVSKRLGNKFELVLSENLEENDSTWIVIYRPIGGYEFRLSSRENDTWGVEFRQEITFGPGVNTRRRVRAAAAVQDRIRSVTLTGDAGFPAEAVLAGTTLQRGERFQFRSWLDDRDRIVRYYWERQYYTARVVPLRTTAESNGTERPVDLQYRVARGRRTVLDVTGYEAGDDLLTHLRQAWSDNVVLDLLNDRLTRTVRAHLNDSGFLRARIDIEIDHPDSDTDRVRIHIDRGRRSDSRQVVFRGNRVVTTGTLHELTAASGLEAAAWNDPGPLGAAVRSAYAARGYLAARVTIGPVEFAADAATLPVVIDEGGPAKITTVHLTGVSPERRSGALEALGVAAGSPFIAGADRTGQARLERYYRDSGFRDVRVETTATVADRGAEVALAFTVNEGRRHVITAVEIQGLQSTSRSLVNQAVQLTPGEPAGAAMATATEKRLYEIGTFRRAEVRLEPAPGVATAAGTFPVTAIVSLEESRRFQLRYGLEVTSEYTSALDQRINALGVAADIRDRNFLGRGMSLGGGLRYEPDLRSARSLFSVPTFKRRPIRTNLFLNARAERQHDEQLDSRDNEVNLTVEQRWRVSRAIEYSWGYSSAWHDAQLTDAASQQALQFDGILASLNGAAVIDRRDSFFDAKRGWFGSASLQWGQQLLGSNVDYLRTLIRASYYQPLGAVVLAGNVRWGRLATFGIPSTLTIFDLFFNAGGTESVRGYSQDALSAYSFADAPLGGPTLVVGNIELRSPLFWRLGGVLFADAGNTFANRQPVRFDQLGVGLGFGLRINTPLAPIRIDLGFPRSFGKTGARWHFSIGQMF